MRLKKVLIAEDEETNRTVISLALGDGDFEMLFARDGEEAVRMAAELRPDLILMDLTLPRINGFEATKLIKADPKLQGIPVVAVTARSERSDEKEAIAAGCDDFIAKPFAVKDLRARLAKYL